MAGQIGLLRDNFQELYYVLKTASSDQLPLVANGSGIRLFAANRLWGVLWKAYYGSDSDQGQRLDALKHALLYTQKLFNATLELLIPQLGKYKFYLRRAAAGYLISEEQFSHTRQIIAEWHESTSPLLKLMKKCKHLHFDLLIRYCFPSNLKPFFLPNAHKSDLRNCQKVIRLEGVLGEPVPLVIFKKIYKEKPLNNMELRELGRWIRKINNLDSEAPAIHAALNALSKLIFSKHSQELLARLEVFLEEKGLEIFQKADPVQLEWRNSLCSGKTIEINGSKITLGHELKEKSLSESNQCRFFRVVQDAELMVLVPHNRATLGMKKFRHDSKQSFAIEPIRLEAFSEKAALVKKFSPLTALRWPSKEKLSDIDQKLLEMLANFLKWLGEQAHTPSHLHVSYLTYDKDFKLKSLTLHKPDSFNFNALEDFAFQCASGSLEIFQHLMKRSNLREHRAVRFYKEIVETCLRKECMPADRLAAVYKIADPRIVEKGIALTKEIAMIIKNLGMQLRPFMHDCTEEELVKKIHGVLVECYKAHHTAGFLWPSLAEEVLKKFRSKYGRKVS